MKKWLIEHGYIPWSKSWIIRMGVMDVLSPNMYDDTVRFLEKQQKLIVLSSDLQALYRVLVAWKAGEEEIDTGESATILRYFTFASWKRDLSKRFIKRGTLLKRPICDNPEIINLNLEQLLKLDEIGYEKYPTSQWASAKLILDYLDNKDIRQEKVENPPAKLVLTYEAIKHWDEQRNKNQCWHPRYDEVILRQSIAFLELLTKGTTSFVPQHAEDYCFARAFGLTTKEEGERRWPTLYGHESNRIKEMEEVLLQADNGYVIDSQDHRVIQAYVMSQKVRKNAVKIKSFESVNKSWPQFPIFIHNLPDILIEYKKQQPNGNL